MIGRNGTERRRGVATVIVAVVFILLSSCGFRPLYGERFGLNAGEDLAAVYIQNVPDREGQQLRNFLLLRMNPKGSPATMRYTLAIQLYSQRSDLGLRRDETASRSNLLVRAIYGLTDHQSGRIVFRGEARTTNSFDILDEEFGTVLAEQDARTKALQFLADDITNQVAIYLSRDERERLKRESAGARPADPSP